MDSETYRTQGRDRDAFLVNRRRFFGIAGVGVVAGGAALSPIPARAAVPADDVPRPNVVPALQRWSARDGWYHFASGTRIVASSGLLDEAETLADDLDSMTGHRPRITSGHPHPGDIVLTLGATERDYTLRVGETLTITAGTRTGAFHGTRTVLQLLRQGHRIPRGLAQDWPVITNREVMIDVGRKYYSLPWLRDLIRELAYLKYDSLHLHLTDDQGFRIESTSHPEVVSPEHYSKREMADLVAFAADYHVTIIPEIDMPGHMTQILAAHPNLRLVGADGQVKDGSLDLSKPGAYNLARELIEEYIPLFPAPYWHLGADEWLPESQINDFPQLDSFAKAHFGPNARARDAFFAFINWGNRLVRSHGKTLRIWNDQLVTGYQVQVDTDVVIDYWYPSDFMPSKNLIDLGYPMINADWNSLYYILGITHPDPGDIYSNFSPTRFADGFEGSTPAGVEFTVWADNPPDIENEDQVAFGIALPLRALAQVAWGSPKPVTDFDEWVPTLDLIGHAPGYTRTDQPLIGVPSSSIPALAGYPLTNLADGRPGTYFRPARSLHPGDEITLDLCTTGRVGQVNLRTKPDAPVRRAVIEVSADNRTWHAAGQVTGQPEVHILLPTGPDARYARLRVLAPQPAPAIGEFGITPLAGQAGALTTSLPAYDVNTLGRVNDDDPSTYFWSSRGAQTDDYLAVDLGSLKPVHAVTLLMTNPPNNTTDYIHHGVLEVSPDGSAWTTLGTFDNQNTITVNAPTGTTGRYLRFRTTAGQGDWVIVRQFTAS